MWSNVVHSLPEEWDQLAGSNPFLKRASLGILAEVNPCEQEYFCSLSKGIICVTYRLRLDLATYCPWFTWRVPVRVVGIPLSVGFPGYAFTKDAQSSANALTAHLRKLPGLTLVLNSNEELPMPGGPTLPSFWLDLPWKDFGEYKKSLRSSYRRRLSLALRKGQELTIQVLADNSMFDAELYQLYQEVYENSAAKLEKQSLMYFQKYPGRILVLSTQQDKLAFAQLQEDDGRLIFVLGGFRRSFNGQYDLYLNLLLSIIRHGLEQGCQAIDFGQTAGKSKSVVGAKPRPKLMYVTHNNPILGWLLERLVPLFAYSEVLPVYHVFKGKD